MEKEFIKIFGEINSSTFREVWDSVYNIINASIPPEEVIVVINSCGGDITESLAILDLLAILPDGFTTINLGMAKNYAAIIFLHGKKRVMADNARFHISTLEENSWDNSNSNSSRIYKKLEELFSTETSMPSDLIKTTIHSTRTLDLDTTECLEYTIATDEFNTANYATSLLKNQKMEIRYF